MPTTHQKEWHWVISVPFEDPSPQTSLALHNAVACISVSVLSFVSLMLIDRSSFLPSPHRYSLPFLCFLPLGDPSSLITPTPFLCGSLSLHQFILVQEITYLCTDVFLVVAVRLRPVAANGVMLTLRGIWQCPETVLVALTGVGLLLASAG